MIDHILIGTIILLSLPMILFMAMEAYDRLFFYEDLNPITEEIIIKRHEILKKFLDSSSIPRLRIVNISSKYSIYDAEEYSIEFNHPNTGPLPAKIEFLYYSEDEETVNRTWYIDIFNDSMKESDIIICDAEDLFQIQEFELIDAFKQKFELDHFQAILLLDEIVTSFKLLIEAIESFELTFETGQVYLDQFIWELKN